MKDVGSALASERARDEASLSGQSGVAGVSRADLLRSIEQRYGYVESDALVKSATDIRLQLKSNLDQLDRLTHRLGFMLKEIRGHLGRRA